MWDPWAGTGLPLGLQTWLQAEDSGPRVPLSSVPLSPLPRDKAKPRAHRLALPTGIGSGNSRLWGELGQAPLPGKNRVGKRVLGSPTLTLFPTPRSPFKGFPGKEQSFNSFNCLAQGPGCGDAGKAPNLTLTAPSFLGPQLAGIPLVSSSRDSYPLPQGTQAPQFFPVEQMATPEAQAC